MIEMCDSLLSIFMQHEVIKETLNKEFFDGEESGNGRQPVVCQDHHFFVMTLDHRCGQNGVGLIL